MPASTYREFRPPPDLEPYVECFWARGDAGGAPTSHRVLPDGCTDILFDLGAWRRGERSEPHGFVVGVMTRARVVATPAPVAIAAVRFRPGQAAAFLRLPAAELTDRLVDLAELWGRDGALAEALATAGADPVAQVRPLAARLRSELPRIAPVDGRVRAAVDALGRSHGTARVAEVARRLGVSRQHLTRLFAEAVGTGPKHLARVLRLRRLLRLAGAGRSDDWADTALAAGYYDQAHMIAEVKALTGLRPTELAQAG